VNKNINYSERGGYSVKIITEQGEFEKLKPVWENIVIKQRAYEPFLSSAWFTIWLRHFLKNNRLLILFLSKGQEVLTIAPFLISRGKFKGNNVKKIELIGNVYSPFRYFLFSDLDYEKRIKNLSIIFEYLVRTLEGWDIVELSGIPEEDSCFDTVRRAMEQGGLKYTEFFCYGDWYLDEIDFSGDEYFNGLPEKIRKDVLYCKRRIEKMGKYEFRLIKGCENIDYYMDLYYDIYAKSWQKKEGIGPKFHRDLAKMALEKGWLRLGFLFFDDVPIATQFWISSNGTAFILKTAYDQDFRKYSPGKLLTSEMAKYAIDIDNVETIDYGQGDEGYKQDWTPRRRERKGIVGFNNNLKGKYLEILTNRVQPVVNKNQFLRKVKEIIKRTAHR